MPVPKKLILDPYSFFLQIFFIDQHYSTVLIEQRIETQYPEYLHLVNYIAELNLP